MFVYQLVLEVWVEIPVFSILALNVAEAPTLPNLWQVVTYVSVYPAGAESVLRVLMMLLFAWWMVSPFETQHGWKRTAQLALAATLGASVGALLVSVALQWSGISLRNIPPVHGAGAVLIAFIAAFGILMGRQRVSLFGVIPMKAITMLWVALGMSVLMFLASGNPIELVADLGAVGAGVFFARWMKRPPKAKKPKKSSKRRPPGWNVIEGGGRGSEPPPEHWLN